MKFALALCFFLLGCSSSVGLCGEVEVCGADGRTYSDRCEASSNGVEIVSNGRCGGCPEVGACPCAPTIEAGCPVCLCEPGDAGEEDSGMEDTSVSDASRVDTGVPPTDGGRVDAEDMGMADEGMGDVMPADMGPDMSGCDETANFLCDDDCVPRDANACEACLGDPCEESGFALECAFMGERAAPECVCAEGYEECDGRCVSTDVNRNHCGECGMPCDGEELCVEGRCRTSRLYCTSGFANSLPEDEETWLCRAGCDSTGLTITLQEEDDRLVCVRQRATGGPAIITACDLALDDEPCGTLFRCCGFATDPGT